MSAHGLLLLQAYGAHQAGRPLHGVLVLDAELDPYLQHDARARQEGSHPSWDSESEPVCCVHTASKPLTSPC